MRSFDAVLPAAILFAGLGVLAGERPLSAQAPSQSPTPPPPVLPGTVRPNSRGDDESNDPLMRQLALQQAIKRNDQRQKLIVDDTARLLTLAQQLKEDADKGKVSQPSVASAKKAEEIERLARTVKEKMREGQ
jgi:hypothetical protein